MGQEVKEGTASWRTPLLAAVAVGVPALLGALLGHPSEGMVAAGGGMSILYLPREFRRPADLLAKLGMRALGMLGCFVAGACGAIDPWLSALALGAVTLAAVFLCRRHAVDPPASFFFVLTAAVAGHAPFDASQLVPRAGWFAAGAGFSCLLGLSVVLLPRPVSTPHQRRPDTDGPALLVEASIIAFFVVLAVGVARALAFADPYWAAVSCIAILQGATFRAVWHRNVNRILGTAAGIALSWWLFPPLVDPVLLAALVAVLMAVVEFLVPRHYGLAAVFITPLAIGFAELGSGGMPIRDLLGSRLVETILGSLVGALGGGVVHHPRFCRWLASRLGRELRRQ